MIVETTLRFERATKNTYKFIQENAEELVVETLYVQKRAFHHGAPSRIKLSIEWAE